MQTEMDMLVLEDCILLKRDQPVFVEEPVEKKEHRSLDTTRGERLARFFNEELTPVALAIKTAFTLKEWYIRPRKDNLDIPSSLFFLSALTNFFALFRDLISSCSILLLPLQLSGKGIKKFSFKIFSNGL